ncbi:MAG: 3'-5' exonuclease [Eubacteriales bacterium]|nr:3'-5' exonuclease [Eubacteriales bacterium]
MSNTTKKKFYYAFFDAEYTCYMESDSSFDRSHSGEILSVGVVLCDRNFRLVRTYYSPICPLYNKKLTRYCKKLTGLTQEEIDAAPSYSVVFQELCQLFQSYPVREIYTWGNDAHTILHDMDANHKSVPRKYRKIGIMMKDITKRLTRKVFDRGMTLSLSDMKYICGMEHHTAHNALDDAMDLYRVAKCCVQGNYDKKAADNMEEFVRKRDVYHQYRRFKKLPEELDRQKKSSGFAELQVLSERYMELLIQVYKNKEGKVPVEVGAFCDDILSLMGKENKHFPELEE